MKIGYSYDIHNLLPGKQIILGGINIACQYRVEAVSDGDIVLHAVSEAILGALGLGDLGDFFTKDNAQGLSSTVILQEVLEKMSNKNYCINNLDITIVLDTPLLKDYKWLIKENLAKLLNSELENINIKATTSENNFTRLIQVHAVILLEQK